MKHVAIVLAGGKGSRMNSDIPKQYMELMGKPVLYYSLKAFEESDIDAIVLVVGKGEIDYCRKNIVERYGIKKVVSVVEGGSERYYSVLNGLRAISGCDYVYVHDGARPCVSSGIIRKCLDEVQIYKACVAAVPVKDTIKVADDNGFAVETPDRSLLWQIQTPQCFEYSLVKYAYEAMAVDDNRGNITDDAMVVEKYTDARVKMTKSEYENIKITTPEDIMIAESFLNKH
ncbi:MAG: 2-C-methyl-D-erythritol 4-phosphate cytidylyltransferase [Lachnospira sp.]|nr:2-C-methyl-D-erythritol 4-phosphate cytidylyltransferase [Lachnospira sp.]